MLNLDKSLPADLEARIRARGMRVEERLALLKKLQEPGGAEEIRRRIETLKQQMEACASKVRGALR
ncbi:MAG: hypothetical protein V2A76_08600 [Planctomycetota bacterium]